MHLVEHCAVVAVNPVAGGVEGCDVLRLLFPIMNSLNVLQIVVVFSLVEFGCLWFVPHVFAYAVSECVVQKHVNTVFCYDLIEAVAVTEHFFQYR